MPVKSIVIDKKAKIITIVADLQDPTPSASGKTMVIASTRGNQATDATFDGKKVTVGLNAYFKA